MVKTQTSGLMLYGFVFGKNWKLSLAELLAFLKKKEISYELIGFSEHGCIIETKVDPSTWIKELGGTLEIFKVLKKVEVKKLKKEHLAEFEGEKIRIYGAIPKIGKLAKKSKVKLRKRKEKKKEEKIIMVIENKAYFGEVISRYDPLSQKKRDTQRPVVRPELSISPSRAMILVNLSRAKENLLDPFCGTGTIGQEAMLLGVKKILMSDNDSLRVKEAKKNLSWVKEKYGLNVEFEVKTCDARKLEKCYKKESIEAIATEPDFGPLLKESIPKKDAEEIISYLTSLYKEFFNSAYRIIKKEGLIAITLPCISFGKGRVYVDKRFKGFRLVDLFEDLPKEKKKKLRKTVVDEEREKGRKRIIAREFCVFKPIKK